MFLCMPVMASETLVSVAIHGLPRICGARNDKRGENVCLV